MKNNSAGVVGGPLLVKRFGALTPPPYIRRCCGAERVKKSNERGSKNKWSVSRAGAGGRRSGNGAVSGTPVNGAER